MSLYELLLNRRSVRKFNETKPASQVIDQLKKAALLSPTGKRKNHWDFIFVEDRTMLKKLSESKPHGSRLIENAALSIVIIGDPTISDTWIEDCSIATIILQIQAQELGLGSCWVQIDKREHNDLLTAGEYIKSLLNIPEEKSVLSVVAIGYPAEKKAPADEASLLFDHIHKEKF